MEISYARFTKKPDWLPRNEKRKGAKANGQRFEKRVHATLLERYPTRYVEGPWICYRDRADNRLCHCQPDGLYIDIEKGLIVVIEVKLKHGILAYQQLARYMPMVEHIFEDFEIRGIEVVKWFDPQISYGSTKTALCADLVKCAPQNANMYNVHILR